MCLDPRTKPPTKPPRDVLIVLYVLSCTLVFLTKTLAKVPKHTIHGRTQQTHPNPIVQLCSRFLVIPKAILSFRKVKLYLIKPYLLKYTLSGFNYKSLTIKHFISTQTIKWTQRPMYNFFNNCLKSSCYMETGTIESKPNYKVRRLNNRVRRPSNNIISVGGSVVTLNRSSHSSSIMVN